VRTGGGEESSPRVRGSAERVFATRSGDVGGNMDTTSLGFKFANLSATAAGVEL
jgi:hypothetical protein